MVTLKAVIESNIDDINGIEADIGKLANKFLHPIDAIRSVAKPAPIQSEGGSAADNFAGIDRNPNRPMESRVNAFLRTLGFPIMDPSGFFYNSGFDPYPKGTTQIFIRSNILLSPLQNILMLREAAVEERRLVFANQDFTATSYALALRYTKPFMIMKIGLRPLDVDNQIFTVADRLAALDFHFDETGRQVFTFVSGSHILKPFIVDPKINDTITPPEHNIAVPFLRTMADASLSQDKPLKRPAIEFICRLRLKDTILDSEFLTEAQRVLSGKSSDQEQTATIIRDTVKALADDNNINDTSILQTIQGFTTTQTAMLTTLVKTIKTVAEKLDDLVREFNQIESDLGLLPVPSIEGPEQLGTGKNSAHVRTFSDNKKLSELNTKIARLKIEQHIQLSQNRITAQTIGDGTTDISSLFAMPVIASVQKDYNTEIQKLENDRDTHSTRILELSADIERITGEVSGLGLIDVLAIYTALWAIDIKTLIGFLDDAAFKRLYDFNTDLRTGEVELRKEGLTLDGITVLTDFENKLFNILSFADKVLTQKRGSPTRADGGDGTQG